MMRDKIRRLLVGGLTLVALPLTVDTTAAQETRWETANAAGLVAYQ